MVDPTPLQKKQEQPDPTDVEPVFPGVEAALVQALDDKRSLSIKTMFLRDTPPAHHEKVLSELFSVTAVIALKEKIVECEREKKNAERRLAELDMNPPKKKELQEEVNKALSEAADLRRKDEHRFRTSGRTGEYTGPVGAVRTELSRLINDRDKKSHELETLNLDLQRQHDELAKAIKNWGIAIENATDEIEIRRRAYET